MNAASLLYNTDSYKVGMFKQYPAGTEFVYSYISSRGGKHKETVILGMQAFIQEYLSKPITKEEVEEAAFFWGALNLPFPKQQLLDMVDDTGGYWPVAIKAVPEGTVVPVNNVVAVVYNTHPKYYFATTWIETALLRAIWYPSTIATNSREVKKVILNYLNLTGTPEDIDFKLHDFGARGVSSLESAMIGAAAHLSIFRGTDTMVANLFINKYYGDTEMRGQSIPASEHSTITSWGREHEDFAYLNMAQQHSGIFACVSDSYDIYNACEMWNTLAPTLKAKGTTLVVRPDSGDPIEVIPQCLRILEKGFGSKQNEKGYYVLDGVRLIWGDGISPSDVATILSKMLIQGWSADNIAFGMGGGLLQAVVRDDQKWAMKASYAVVNGEGVDVYKDPITDPGKTSMRGKVRLVKTYQGKFITLPEGDYVKTPSEDALDMLYNEGYMFNKTSFAEVVERANIGL